jgi:hypothetical protein
VQPPLSALSSVPSIPEIETNPGIQGQGPGNLEATKASGKASRLEMLLGCAVLAVLVVLVTAGVVAFFNSMGGSSSRSGPGLSDWELKVYPWILFFILSGLCGGSQAARKKKK